MKITIRNVRIAFAEGIFTAKKSDGGATKYSATFLFPSGGKVEDQIKEVIEEVGAAFFTDKWQKFKKEKQANNKLILHDGDLKGNFDGFEGNSYLIAYNTVRPKIRDLDGQTPIVLEDGKIYSGCYVDAILDISAYKSDKHGGQMSVTLMGVQFRRDGDAFTGGAPVADDNDFVELTGINEDLL